ncbi:MULTISPECIES: MFS transporter [Sphingobacterium]|jgi:predicted MFS family arabinose efflux permease|uniref:Purine efflux pump PbuE n=1 Tax=Sphingobacterium multivorum TaxID=28454 RepID=A0A653Y0Y3_SPHMU|nr:MULTISPECIES: MFS transporter [Sphingobacterium]HBI88597.1 MFS transporter [Sphingobacterium sp.]QQT47037.1 MFS transporter [Sphingobacterium multivorum]QQT60445.1 MFS transporter [Sphingobacterium multivorum]SUJ88373.1 Purine efflux pump PbuE [Sphingobacterium multivorum]VXC36085.1 Purine efflux pump PbuE [Sphingobacterium multivorum]
MKKYAYIGALGFLAVITTEFGIIGILPQLADHYHISIDKAGYLLSAFALIIAITGPFMTLLASGFDRKKVMLTAIAIFLVTAIVSSLSPPFWFLLIVRILPAFLQPVYIATALSVAILKGGKQNENELMSIVFSGVAIAMVTTVPFATYIASLSSWTYSFTIQAVVSIIALLAIYLAIPPLPVKEKKTYGSQMKILTKPIFLVSTAMNFFMVSAWFSTYSYFAEYLNKAKNMDSTMVSYMLFVFGIIGVIANWVAGKMLNRNITFTTAFFLSGTLIIPLLLYFSDGNLFATVCTIALWGFLYSPSFLNASTYMISSAPEALEFANSLATSFGNLGVTLGTTVGGWIIVSKGVEFSPWLTMSFGFLAFLMIALRQFLEKRSAIKQITVAQCTSQ